MSSQSRFIFRIGLLLLSAVPLSAVAQPTVRLEPKKVVIEKVTNGTTVAVFALLRAQRGYDTRDIRVERTLVDHDRDGIVEIEWSYDIPLQSIWIAVDMISGAHGVATPEEMPLRTFALTPDAVSRSPVDDRISAAREYVELFYVRPGVGSWGLSMADGGPDDLDGVDNGLLTIGMQSLKAVSASLGTPLRTVSGDLLFVVDAHQMELAVFRVR